MQTEKETLVLPIETTDTGPQHRLRKAARADRSYMKDLCRRHYEAIGFLTAQAITEAIDQGRVIIGTENGEPAGYLLFKHRMPDNPGITAIFQAVIQMDARRHSLGRKLVAAVSSTAQLSGNDLVQLWCAEGLEANEFWPAAGFTAQALRPGGTKRNRIHVLWRKTLSRCDPGEFPISQRRRVRAGPPVVLPKGVTTEQIVAASKSRTLSEFLTTGRTTSPGTTPKSQLTTPTQPALFREITT